jgi:hypothetical protein
MLPKLEKLSSIKLIKSVQCSGAIGASPLTELLQTNATGSFN